MDLTYLDIPANKIKQLQAKGFNSLEDLVAYYPRKYIDFRKTIKIEEAREHEGELVAVFGYVSNIKISNSGKAVFVNITDKTKTQKMSIVFFNQEYIVKQFVIGGYYVFCGKVSWNSQYQSSSITAPMYYAEGEKAENCTRLIPVYAKVRGMAAEYLEACIRQAIEILTNSASAVNLCCDYLEPEVIKRLGTISKVDLWQKAHHPKTDDDVRAAQKRIVIDELFPFAMKMGQKKYEHISATEYLMPKQDGMKKFIANLPFKFTEGQAEAINTVVDIMQKQRVDALLQGDVGCGKTVVALTLAALVIDNGFQAAIMAPTSVLAEQHYKEACERFKGTGVKVAYLTGSLKAKERRAIITEIFEGKVDLVVGTHAVISKDVVFNRLALTVVDEEHRFGVEQRNALKEKAKNGVHTISMSATPIPRTLATSIYGENINVINIRSMPTGRKPVQTILYSNEEKVYEAIYRQIKEGRQCYVICPLIEDSDDETMADVDSVEKTYQKMTEYFASRPEVNIAMITGKMKKDEINDQIALFTAGDVHVLISTTIVEVGVNVPNASVILIKNAERFGLAQLHQLRGRVGRGKHQSYCVLLSDHASENPKLIAMSETNDGFEIAQRDLELRGTGDVVGTKQSGIDKYITLMLQNKEIYAAIGKEVDTIFEGKLRYDKYAALE